MTHRITCLCYMIVIQHCVSSEFKKYLSNNNTGNLCFTIHLWILKKKKSTWTMEYSSNTQITFRNHFIDFEYQDMWKNPSEVDSVVLMSQVGPTTLTENDWTFQISKQMKNKSLEGRYVYVLAIFKDSKLTYWFLNIGNTA